MKLKFTLTTLTLLSTMSLSVLCHAESPDNDNETMQMGVLKGMERCYGIAKAHRNDCGTKRHACAGEGKGDANAEEWIAVPDGLCEKIVGGSLTKKS